MIKCILSNVVSFNQYSFIPSRHITENIIIFHGMIHTFKNKKGKKGGMITKVNLEKAHDRMEWKSIRETLRDVGLPSLMVDTIMRCISNGSFHLLWNGEVTDKVKPTGGLRQGDPLSPYIFVFCVEWLAHLIQIEVADGNWKPLKASIKGPNISHLFLADDLLFFAESLISQVKVIKNCPEKFSAASGQKANYQMS